MATTKKEAVTENKSQKVLENKAQIGELFIEIEKAKTFQAQATQKINELILENEKLEKGE